MDRSRPTIREKAKKQEDGKLADSFNEEGYEENKSTVAIVMGHFFLRYLNLLYHAFDGDMLAPMVLGEIAHHNVVKSYSRKGDCWAVQKHLSNPADRLKHLAPSNAFSISEATGIPRETVRRKIDKLVRSGWLLKNARGEVTISSTVADHFMKDFNKILLSELLETSACIIRLLATEYRSPAGDQDCQNISCKDALE